MRQRSRWLTLAIILAIAMLCSPGNVSAADDNNQTECDATLGALACGDPAMGGKSCYSSNWAWDDFTPVTDGTYFYNCCGDDASEYHSYFNPSFSVSNCNDVTVNNCVGVNKNQNDDNCCDENSDCVFQGACYSNSSTLDIDGDGVAGEYCEARKWYDCDNSQASCEDATYCGSLNWVIGGELSTFGEYNSGTSTECCGDDSGEAYLYQVADSSMDGGYSTEPADEACCNSAGDCVNASRCYSSGTIVGVDSDEDDDYCLSGTWYDCQNSSECEDGYECVDNDCVDVTHPIIPFVWWPEEVTTNSSINVYGWINESGIDVLIDVLSEETLDIDHFSDTTTILANLTATSILTRPANRGSKYVFLDLVDGYNTYFATDKYLSFSNHINQYALYYDINRQDTIGYELKLNFTTGLYQSAANQTNVTGWDSLYPSGWFNISVNLYPGENTLSIMGRDSSSNLGLPKYLSIVRDTGAPSFNLSTIKNETNNPVLHFIITDQYDVNLTTLFLNVSNGLTNYYYTYNLSYMPALSKKGKIYCSGTPGNRNCSVNLNLSENRYNLSFSVFDFVDQDNSSAKLNFILDYTAEYSMQINDSGDLTSTKILNATWTPYSDTLSGLDHYEYAIGTAIYPASGWNSLVNWTNVSANSAQTAELDLVHSNNYYWNVRARNLAGNYSNVHSSNGIIFIDDTAPIAPTITDDGNYIGTNLFMHGTWWSQDNESGITNYEIAIGNAAYPSLGWNLVLLQVLGNVTDYTFNVLLVQNTTYYFTVRAKNGYGVWGQRASSNGVTVDITAPTGGYINYLLGDYTTNTVTINFSQGSDNESGIKVAELYSASLLFRDGECSGTFIYDTFEKDVTGDTGAVLNINNGYCYKYKLIVENYANLSSEYYHYQNSQNDTIRVDTTPPRGFGVYDSGTITYDGTQLTGSWDSSDDDESDIARYEYRVQYTVNDGTKQTLVNWKNNQKQTSFIETFELDHSNMTHQYKYYIDVKAINGLGLNTTNTSDGIIYLDIVPPVTQLYSVGTDLSAPYSDTNFGITYINVTGEEYMKCVYSENDIDYSDSADDCTTTGTMASCPINLSSGNYVYHIICRDKNGNGQDFDENIDVNFTVIAYTEYVHTVNINSTENLEVEYYYNDVLQSEQASNISVNSSVFAEYKYDIKILNNESSFSVLLQDVNITYTDSINITASYYNHSQINNSNLSIGPASRYRPIDAYAIEVTSNYNSTYSVVFNKASSGTYGLKIFKLGYNFSTQVVNYNNSVIYTPSRSGTLSTITVTNFSLFVLTEDISVTEVCSDNVDNDGDGSTDEGCAPQNPGGGSSPGGGDSTAPATRRSSGAVTVESCFDGAKNQDETGIDCGGTCTELKTPIRCTAGTSCIIDNDCMSKFCSPKGKCEVPSCSDGWLNQDEEDIDCGGECGLCASCFDGVKNQDETGVDCGGTCTACATCDDGIKNQGEDWTDCGGPCKPCETCFDGIKNQNEEDTDCGGICKACVEVEQPGTLMSYLPFLIGGGVLLIVFAGLGAMKLSKKEPLPEPKPVPLPELNLPKPEPKPMPKPEPKPIILSDESLLKLSRFVNYSLATGLSKEMVAAQLNELHWPQQTINTVMQNTGDIDLITALLEINSYVSKIEAPKEEIKKILKSFDIDEVAIDIVLYNVNLVEQPETLSKFITFMLVKEKNPADLTELMKSLGWPDKILSEVIRNCNETVPVEVKLIEKIASDLIHKNLDVSKVSEVLITRGYNSDIVDTILYMRYSKEKNIDKLVTFINLELEQGRKINDIKDKLIKAGWSIDVIDSVISRKFIETDMKHLLELEKYIDNLLHKGLTKPMIRKKLIEKKWESIYVDMVLHEVHIVDDKLDKLKGFINVRIKAGDDRKTITEILVKVGWARKVVSDLFDKRITVHRLK